MQPAEHLDRTSAALAVERLTKVYGDGTKALDELNLRIPAGCFFGLLGPNGAGKTTLIGATAGLVRTPAGHIFVFGHDAALDLQSRLLVGVAPQEVHLDRFLTAGKYSPTTDATSGCRSSTPNSVLMSCSTCST